MAKLKFNCGTCNKEFYNTLRQGKQRIYCSKPCHYKRTKLNDEEQLELLKTRLIKYSKTNSNTRCIEWTKHKNPKGYGVIRWKNVAIFTHRASWLINNGDIPKNKFVLHSCNNTSCLFIEHLYLGTSKENSEYMVSLGRHRPVYSKKTYVLERSRAKITAIQVRKIKVLLKTKMTAREISEETDASIHSVNDIKRNKTWKHIKD